MGMWEFFKKRKEQERLDKKDRDPFQNKILYSTNFNTNYYNFGVPKEERYPYFSNNIPTPEQIDAVNLNIPIDISKMIVTSSTPDHRIGSMILSNIFLIPKNMKRAEDSWPYYHENIETNKKIQIELMERKAKEDLIALKGKGKKVRNQFYQLLRAKREIMNNYYEEYLKILSSNIQKIRVEIIPIEKEISESKYKLNDVKQKLNGNRVMQLEKIKEYNQLLDSNVKSLTKIKDAVKNILSLKKLWQAAHIVASYIVAFFGATELVKTEQFKLFIKDKLAKFSLVGDFISANFTIVQGLAAALIFLVTVGMYDKFVIDYLKRRAIKREINELAKKEREYIEELNSIEQKISVLKEERNNKVKLEIQRTEQDLEFLYEEYKSQTSDIQRQMSVLLKEE
ncbi:MAG: hypothetical protein QXK21_00905 [Candidatus Micrarchaeia archaeon]